MRYLIGDFARMAQISPKQLKYYEQCGLIVPAHTDADSGYRYYEIEQLRAVAHIRAFMSMGFSTAEISGLLAGSDYAAAFARKKTELEGELSCLRQKLSLLSFYRDALREHDFNQPYRAMVKTMPRGLYASLRRRFPNVSALTDAWGPLLAEVRRTGASPSPGLSTLARFWDDEFSMTDIDAELLLGVNKRGEASELFAYRELAPAQAVSVIHRGGYDLINEAYAFAYLWIDRGGHSVAGLPIEAYLCGPASGPPTSEYITELYIPFES